MVKNTIRITELDLDKSDIKRLEDLLKELKDEIKDRSSGLVFPLRAIEHRKKNGRIDWVDEWELSDDWDGRRTKND